MTPRPPVARRSAASISIHGRDLTDDYAWLRERGSDEVREYLEDTLSERLQALKDLWDEEADDWL